MLNTERITVKVFFVNIKKKPLNHSPPRPLSHRDGGGGASTAGSQGGGKEWTDAPGALKPSSHTSREAARKANTGSQQFHS